MLYNKVALMCANHAVTYDEIAKACNVRTETISRIAKGKYNPTVTLALKIATYFCESVDNIFSLDISTSNDVCYASKFYN